MKRPFSQTSTVSSGSISRRSEGRSSSRRSEVAASPSLRAASFNKHAVMFTGFISESDSALVKDLGGFLTEELSKCTVLVADSMKRTVKLLCMVGRGVPVVGESWLVESRASKRLVDPWPHILKEPAAEKKLGMRLEESVRLAKKLGMRLEE